MKSKIRVLTDDTINKIAAGEVVENPASVVKELVENSIDAGASEVCIEIRGGGRQLIRVSDDGCGMNGDDALLCLERHATSKIRTVEDIHSVITMGFRGEAMPSIASISKFTLLTSPRPEGDGAKADETTLGTMVIVEGGKIINCSPAARSPGTTIEVKTLFFNVPVRKKFLKSPAIDAHEILKMISTIALGNPKLKFRLINDGKEALMASPAYAHSSEDRFNARIEAVLGQDYLQNTVFLDRKEEGMSLYGVTGLPGYTRHNRSGQYLFINHRPVFSPLVAYAIKEGYGTALAAGRHPVFVLHLSLDGGFVDVNVHPQKKEVRLRQEQQLKNLIIKAIQQGLHQRLPNIGIDLPPTNRPAFTYSWKAEEYEREITNPFPSSFNSRPEVDCGSFPQTSEFQPMLAPLLVQSIPSTALLQADLEEQPGLPFQFNQRSAPPRAIATIPGYILLDGHSADDPLLQGMSRANGHTSKGGIFLIDQKAAHSRVIFEKLEASQNPSFIARQTLLIPLTVETTPVEAGLLRNALPSLNQMGIEIQEFGPNTFLVNAIPEIFGNNDIQRLVADILHALQDEHAGQLFHEERNKRIALAASRNAVANDRRLTLEEAQSLIQRLWNCSHPCQCPQGRPTFIQIPPEDLAKQFQKYSV